MFTGLIEDVGEIHDRVHRKKSAVLVIRTRLPLREIEVGASIAVNGVCLTAVALTPNSFTVDVSAETLRCTEGFAPGAEVNLEKALRLADRLGGHLVSGHVDGVGDVHHFAPVGESHLLEIDAPSDLARYIIRKGSITVNGTSLTTNDVDGADFTINLIPHTLQNTTLHLLAPGAKVNLEVDLLARYLERLIKK